MCTPAESVEYPLTNWKYCVMRKMNPNRQKKATEMESAPPLNRGILNTRTSSSGPSVRSSSSVKTVNSTAATAKQASVPVDAQPHCGPSMMPSTNDVTPTVESSTPRRSKGCSAILGSRGISTWPATSVTMTIGTFTRKIDPYQKCSSSAPPVIGPKATAMPGRGSPDAQCLLALGWVGEDAREDGQAGREDEGGGDAHQRPGS